MTEMLLKLKRIISVTRFSFARYQFEGDWPTAFNGLLHLTKSHAQLTLLCASILALLLITGIILAAVLLRRQRKLKKQLDELTLLLKEKRRETQKIE